MPRERGGVGQTGGAAFRSRCSVKMCTSLPLRG
uniref:Uncharacterized protein n=1 Tax=Anguilla anguilla TaxID=7936 RepID=A0A0E9RHF3_ANGAN